MYLITLYIGANNIVPTQTSQTIKSYKKPQEWKSAFYSDR